MKKSNIFFHKNLGTVSLFSNFDKNLCTYPISYIYYFSIFIQNFLKNRQFIFHKNLGTVSLFSDFDKNLCT